jgi:hypothetical protein
MDAIITEFEPPEDAFRITNAFVPQKNVNDEELITLVKAGAFGMTNPVMLGGDHMKVSLPTHYYKEHRPGYWRESIMFDEEVLQRVKKPEDPQKLWGEELIGEALNVLDLRLNTLIEYLAAETVFSNGFTVAKNSVNYSYSANIPAKYYVYTGLSSSKPTGYSNATWKTGAAADLWSAKTTAKPLYDIREAIDFFARQGFRTSEIWMARKVAGYIEDNVEGTGMGAGTTAGAGGGMRNLIMSNPQLAGQMITAENIVLAVSGLKGLKPVIEERRYLEETGLVLPAAAAATTIYVQDTASFTASDTVTIRSPGNLTEEDVKIESLTAVTGKVELASSTPLVNAVVPGDRMTVSKLFMPEALVTFRGAGNGRISYANWVSTPSLVKAKSYTNPVPGRYTWRTFNDRVPYWVEVGAGINGGPIVHSHGNWMILRVA